MRTPCHVVSPTLAEIRAALTLSLAPFWLLTISGGILYAMVATAAPLDQIMQMRWRSKEHARQRPRQITLVQTTHVLAETGSKPGSFQHAVGIVFHWWPGPCP